MPETEVTYSYFRGWFSHNVGPISINNGIDFNFKHKLQCSWVSVSNEMMCYHYIKLWINRYHLMSKRLIRYKFVLWREMRKLDHCAENDLDLQSNRIESMKDWGQWKFLRQIAKCVDVHIVYSLSLILILLRLNLWSLRIRLISHKELFSSLHLLSRKVLPKPVSQYNASTIPNDIFWISAIVKTSCCQLMRCARTLPSEFHFEKRHLILWSL